MCRIAGIIDRNQPVESLAKAVKSMCDVMAHGGPDDEGFYSNAADGIVLGHRRLALIDLSTKGHQPMVYQHGKLIISFNGEIYNYLELKEELQNRGFKFATQSDTEVILAAYAAWGIASFNKLKGMFAFSLYDAGLSRTYLVRDASGIKPLYYSATAKHLVFSSEVKAFKNSGYSYSSQADWKILFLAFGHLPEPYTTLAEVMMLPKGHYLVWAHQSDAFEIKSYYQPRQLERLTKYDEATEAIQLSLQQSVNRHLLSDAKIGAFLSGGIDSSILTLAAAEILNHTEQNINTISINFEEAGFSEKVYQDIIVEQVKGSHHEYAITPTLFAKHFQTALKAMDQPTADGINSWFINLFAKENGLKAVLSGIGADELFGGYPSFKRMGWINLLKKLPRFITKKAIHFKNTAVKRTYYLSYRNTIGEYLFLRGLFAPDEIAQLLNCPLNEVDRVLQNANITSAPPHLTEGEKASWLECNLYMQNQLLKDTDMMSMQHGVEVRLPFLDQDLLNTVAAINSNLKFKGKRPKSLLIDAFSAVLPDKIWNRPKMGFTFPFQAWLKQDSHFIETIKAGKNKCAVAMAGHFEQGNLHWSKAMALYQLFKRV